MTMQLIEALTILAAGNCGELNYSANEETRAIFNEARRVVGHTATQLVDARHLTSQAGGFIPKTKRKEPEAFTDFRKYGLTEGY